MDNGFQLIRRHDTLILGLLNLGLVEMLKHPVTALATIYSCDKKPTTRQTYRLQAM
jgi:hypothetical protein